MTMTITIALICIVVHALMAYIGARNEADTVYQRMATGDVRDLDHAPLLLFRAIITVFFIAGVLVFFAHQTALHDILLALALALIALGTHAPVHRLVFNNERNNHPCYLSPGNNYDSHFLRQTVKPWPLLLRQRYASYYQGTAKGSENIREQVHAAGRNAYRVELCTLAAGLLLAVLIPIITT